MGHISSKELAALGIATMIFVFLYGSFLFLRVGTTGITAQAFGRGDRNQIQDTLLRSVALGVAIALMIFLLRDFILDASLFLMNADVAYRESVKSYYDIRVVAVFAFFIESSVIGWFFGMQNAIYPLIITITVNSINIVASYYLVQVQGLGIEGVAYGTLIARSVGVILAISLLFFRYGDIFRKISLKRVFDKSITKFLTINSNIFLRTLTLTFALGFLYSQAAKESEKLLAVMVVLMQFLIWMSYAVDGFAGAAESLSGKYYGKKDWKGFYKAIRLSFVYGGAFATIFSLVYLFFGEDIIKIFTNDPDVVAIGVKYIPLVALLPLISFWAFMWDGVFIGMTASKALRDVVVISFALFVLFFYLFKEVDYGYALWGGFMLFFLFRSILQTVLFFKKGINLK
jgi:MATE family multidrug resistance protein